MWPRQAAFRRPSRFSAWPPPRPRAQSAPAPDATRVTCQLTPRLDLSCLESRKVRTTVSTSGTATGPVPPRLEHFESRYHSVEARNVISLGFDGAEYASTQNMRLRGNCARPTRSELTQALHGLRVPSPRSVCSASEHLLP
eukprot:7315831-Prymnesium_polylepis.2